MLIKDLIKELDQYDSNQSIAIIIDDGVYNISMITFIPQLNECAFIATERK